MSAESSAYQSFKLWLAEYVPVDRDILHVLMGLMFLLTAVFASRRGLRLQPFARAVLGALLLAIAMEVLDRFDDLRSLGHWRWQASLSDIGRTVLFPAFGLIAAWCLSHLKRSP